MERGRCQSGSARGPHRLARPREAYVVQYSIQELDSRGKRKRVIKTFDRKKDADAFQAQVRVDLGKGTHVPASKALPLPRPVATGSTLALTSNGPPAMATSSIYATTSIPTSAA